MVVFPNAKINLGLNILSRRPDGYHNISTAMVPIGWCDVLEVVTSKSGDTTLTVSGNKIDCPPEKNLVMKAFHAVNDVISIPPTDIYLRKIVPDGAGLGGGSSDAAFTVKALNELYSLGLSDEIMAEICGTLGADCPFFIYNRPMLASGIGTELMPVNISGLQHLYIIVIKPDIHVSTAEAYAGVKPHLPEKELTEVLTMPVSEWRTDLLNDFQPQIVANHHRIGTLVDMLYSHNALYAAMSGSGSAVFGLMPTPDMTDIIAELDITDNYYSGKLIF